MSNDLEETSTDSGRSQHHDTKSMIREFLEERSNVTGELLRATLLERWENRESTGSNHQNSNAANSNEIGWTFVSKRDRRVRRKENQLKAFTKQRSIEISIPITVENSFAALKTGGSSHQVSVANSNSWITK